MKTLYLDIFLGKRLPFPMVESYVKNTWAKYGIKQVMMNAGGFFFFQFYSQNGLNSVMEHGPWIIRSLPLFLYAWSPSSVICKGEITKVPVWIKLHDVPLLAYSEDSLSMLATKVGKPIILDTYTSNMCVESWGRSSYARVLVELNAVNDIKESLVVGIPELIGDGILKHKVDIKYEWSPPHCNTCKVFSHSSKQCPKQVQIPKFRESQVDEEGFIDVKKKGKLTHGASTGRQISGLV